MILPQRLRSISIKRPTIGLRLLKSGLAVTLMLYLAQTPLIENPFYAAIGTIYGMQATLKGSVKEGKGRFWGCLIGGLIGYLMVSTHSPTPLTIGLATMLCILACTQFGLDRGVNISLTVCLSIIIDLTVESPLTYSINRALDMSCGILFGLAINRFIAKPSYSQNISTQIHQLQELTDEALTEFYITQDISTLAQLKQEILVLDAYFKDYKRDIPYKRHHRHIHSFPKQVKACHELYFHLKSLKMLKCESFNTSIDQAMVQFHLEKIEECFEIIEKYTDDDE